STSARVRHRCCCSVAPGGCAVWLEEIADGELEHERVLVDLRAVLGVERNTPFEAQGADRREPPEAEADRFAQACGQRLERTEARVELDRDRRVVLLAARAVAILEVVRVAHVEEHDAGDPDLLEQRELDLAVEDDLEISAEREQTERLAEIAGRLGL